MENITKIIEINATELDKNKRLDVFLSESIEDSTRTYIDKLISDNLVFIFEKVQNKKGKKLKGNEYIKVYIPEEKEMDIEPENIPLDIVYEDDYLMIINKQANLVVHPAYGNYTGTLVNGLLYYVKNLSDVNGIIRPGIVHRLDKDTSGLIIVAKDNVTHHKLSQMFSEKKVKKHYLAIVKGNFSEENLSSRIETLIGRDIKDRKKMSIVNKNGKIAITNYKVLNSSINYSLVEVNIETGRTHQIRVHMKHLNHPIVGDSVYGIGDKNIKRQMLHAFKLEFEHPITNKPMKIISELPDDFLETCKRLSLNI